MLGSAVRAPCQVRIADEGLAVSGDHQVLAMAITDLVLNAAKYSSVDSPIAVSVQERDNQVVVSVHNEGFVIDGEDRELMFERFYRSPASKHRASGSGIGQSIAKKAAQAHQGNVWVSARKKQYWH